MHTENYFFLELTNTDKVTSFCLRRNTANKKSNSNKGLIKKCAVKKCAEKKTELDKARRSWKGFSPGSECLRQYLLYRHKLLAELASDKDS